MLRWELRGFADSLIGMVTSPVTIAGDVGIVSLSAIIPDPIEPELIKTKADETFEGYKETAIQLIQNPMSIIELAAQSVSDTVETEGKFRKCFFICNNIFLSLICHPAKISFVFTLLRTNKNSAYKYSFLWVSIIEIHISY